MDFFEVIRTLQFSPTVRGTVGAETFGVSGSVGVLNPGSLWLNIDTPGIPPKMTDERHSTSRCSGRRARSCATIT